MIRWNSLLKYLHRCKLIQNTGPLFCGNLIWIQTIDKLHFFQILVPNFLQQLLTINSVLFLAFSFHFSIPLHKFLMTSAFVCPLLPTWPPFHVQRNMILVPRLYKILTILTTMVIQIFF